jgi:NTE family protein
MPSDTREQADPQPRTHLIDIALQGGGSHGAFGWGALDRLLDLPDIEVEGISGTSAGAMNAAVFAHGFRKGGRKGAKAALETFWKRVSAAARFSPFQRSPVDVLLGKWTLDSSPLYIAMDLMARLVSPYSFGVAWNPLRDILVELIDFDELVRSPIKLFITATNVRSGRGRVFRNHELTADVLLASACLPTMFQAVEIDGEFYWDGGYAGNPTLTPLVRECQSHDTFLVQINPVNRNEIPRTARDILSRVNEVSFNATLLKEMRMIALLRQVVDPGNSEGRLWAEMRLHRITSDLLVTLGASSKMNAEWAFLEMLRDEGRRAVDEFRERHGQDVGVRSTVDLDALLKDV